MSNDKPTVVELVPRSQFTVLNTPNPAITETLASIVEANDAGELEYVMCISLTKDGVIKTAMTSADSAFQQVGVLQLGYEDLKQGIMDKVMM